MVDEPDELDDESDGVVDELSEELDCAPDELSVESVERLLLLSPAVLDDWPLSVFEVELCPLPLPIDVLELEPVVVVVEPELPEFEPELEPEPVDPVVGSEPVLEPEPDPDPEPELDAFAQLSPVSVGVQLP